MFDLIIIGGGPAGVFASITCKNLSKKAKVLILEKTDTLLSKILLSGGGRCNLTNATFDPLSLSKNYPRGERELIGPFSRFQPKDIMRFFSDRKVKLKIEKDGRVFPLSDSAKTIRDCLLKELEILDVKFSLKQKISSIKKEKSGFSIISNDQTYHSKKLLVATGSSPLGYKWAKEMGHKIEEPLPSLFAFDIKPSLKELSGISLTVDIKIKDSSFSQSGPLLFTHFGISGPAVLKLSALAARDLNEKSVIEINWICLSFEIAFAKLLKLKKLHPKKQLQTMNLFSLPQRVFRKFLEVEGLIKKPLLEISLEELKRLSQKLTKDSYQFCGKSLHKNEFVTSGGVVLNEINFQTMESKICPHLFFAGEILNIDGLTGGFNFQNAWTTGFIAGNISQ